MPNPVEIPSLVYIRQETLPSPLHLVRVVSDEREEVVGRSTPTAPVAAATPERLKDSLTSHHLAVSYDVKSFS